MPCMPSQYRFRIARSYSANSMHAYDIMTLLLNVMWACNFRYTHSRHSERQYNDKPELKTDSFAFTMSVSLNFMTE